jgi:hypothetical protein
VCGPQALASVRLMGQISLTSTSSNSVGLSLFTCITRM